MRIILIISFIIVLFGTTAFSEIRVVTYNMKASDGLSSYADEILQAIGSENINGIARPIDILSLQEMKDGGFTIESQIATALNNIYGAGTYAYSTLNATGDGYEKVGMVYNTHTVQIIDQVAFKDSSAPRKTGRYHFRIIGYGHNADVYVYCDHYKASDGSSERYKRAIEATRVRWDKYYGGDSLPAGTNIIYAGDYNPISPFDDAVMGTGYDTTAIGGYDNPWYYLVSLVNLYGPVGSIYVTTGNGQADDPTGITSLVNWNTSPYKALLTIDSTTPDARFDFQLISKPIHDGRGVSIIQPGIGNCRAAQNSYHVFGNDGTFTWGGRLVDAVGSKYDRTLVYHATLCSDHLPVVADYQTPAIMSVEVNMPNGPIQQGSGAVAYIKISNGDDPNVTASVGADQLDYQIQVMSGGTLIGDSNGVAYALDGNNVHEVLLDTSASGSHSLHINVTSSSEACVNASYDQSFLYNVGEYELSLADFASAWLSVAGDVNYNSQYDLNFDNVIDFRDFALLATMWTGDFL